MLLAFILFSNSYANSHWLSKEEQKLSLIIHKCINKFTKKENNIKDYNPKLEEEFIIKERKIKNCINKKKNKL